MMLLRFIQLDALILDSRLQLLELCLEILFRPALEALVIGLGWIPA